MTLGYTTVMSSAETESEYSDSAWAPTQSSQSGRVETGTSAGEARRRRWIGGTSCLFEQIAMTRVARAKENRRLLSSLLAW